MGFKKKIANPNPLNQSKSAAVKSNEIFTPDYVNPRNPLPTPVCNWKELRVAFCFLADGAKTDGNVHPLWESFFDKAKALGLNFEILIHTTKQTVTRFKDCVLSDSVQTSWERTVPAHKVLIKHAKNRKADKAVFLSDKCIPFWSPEVIWQRLAVWDKTILNNVRSRLSLDSNRKTFKWPETYKDLWKAEQWAYVDKRHFDLYDETDIAPLFARSFADNEGYLLYLLRRRNESKNVICFAPEHSLHYCKWFSQRPNPVCYYPLDKFNEGIRNKTIVSTMAEVLKPEYLNTYRQYAIFGRKFDHGCNLEFIKKEFAI